MDSNGHSSDPGQNASETPDAAAAAPVAAPASAAPVKGRMVAWAKTTGKMAGAFVFGIALLTTIVHFGSRLAIVGQAKGAAHGAIAEATAPIVQSWNSLESKVEALDHADDENTRLRTENAKLKLQIETLRFGCQAKNASLATEQAGSRLSLETGSKIGRTLASFSYRVPDQLPASQLYALGVSYFKAGENEKAAAVLSTLITNDDTGAYKNGRDLLMTGVAWYRVDNFDLAEQFFDEVLKMTESEATIPYLAKARAWKALISERRGKHFKAQYWLRELVDHSPRSVEAGWINGANRAPRTPASVSTEKHDASTEP